jgi:UPF0755 protein
VTPRGNRRGRHVITLAAWVLLGGAAACGSGEGSGEPVQMSVPAGASFSQVSDTLAARGIINMPAVFNIYARMRGATGGVQPGTYAFRPGTAWSQILADLNAGRVQTMRIVVPEAWDLRGIAPRISAATGLDEDSVMYVLTDTAVANRFGVPGPTLEGYLYPATYTFSLAAPLDTIISRMVATYRRVWTEERAARAEAMGLNQREVVTLASII